MLKKKVVVTGGTGSWGHKLIERLLSEQEVEKIFILSRNESKQVEMERFYNNSKLQFIICDITNRERLRQCTKGADILYHLAALKHVPVCENNVAECISTNILGTQNVADCVLENNISEAIYISTDKAVMPVNVYGASKAVGEKIWISSNYKNNNSKFVVVRSGNVLGTNGSVIPFFREQIEKDNIIKVTSEEMTRFFIDIAEAINLIMIATKNSQGGEIFVIKMDSYNILDLARDMAEKYGDNDTKIEIVGARKGEKIHELLISEMEAKKCYILNDKYYIICEETSRELSYSHLKKVDFIEYSSKEAVKNILDL